MLEQKDLEMIKQVMGDVVEDKVSIRLENMEHRMDNMEHRMDNMEHHMNEITLSIKQTESKLIRIIDKKIIKSQNMILQEVDRVHMFAIKLIKELEEKMVLNFTWG